MTLARVTRAARARTTTEVACVRAREAYHYAVRQAAQKHSYADIARAAGVSRQAVRQLLLRGVRKD